MKKQKVPRKRIEDGLSLKIYQKFGWQPSDSNYTELDEIESRRKYVLEKGISKNVLKILDQMSHDYEKKYNFLKPGKK